MALKSTIDLTCNDYISVFEFDIFTRLFQVSFHSLNPPLSCVCGAHVNLCVCISVFHTRAQAQTHKYVGNSLIFGSVYF